MGITRFQRVPFDSTLRPFLEVYWEMDRFDEQPADEPIPAVAVLHIVWHEGDISETRHNINGQDEIVKLAGTIIAGLVDRPGKKIIFQGHVHALGITFTPLGLYHLLGVRPSLVMNDGLPYADHCSYPLPEIYRFRKGQEGMQERVNEVQNWCMTLYKERVKEFSEVEKLIFNLRESLGKVKVFSLIEKQASRNLERQFKSIMGMSPKHYARLLRFNSALTLLSREPEIPLLEAVVRTGYYDVAHLCRDFKALHGPLPTQWAKDPQAHTAYLIDPLK
ncbi:MAG: helix-turn-helix domain-containing protein [Bacteroidota bacterium]